LRLLPDLGVNLLLFFINDRRFRLRLFTNVEVDLSVVELALALLVPLFDPLSVFLLLPEFAFEVISGH